MQAQIIQIGNSLGIRLPKAMLASLQMDRATALDIQTRGDSIVLRRAKVPRQGWAEAFAAAPLQVDEDLWGDLPVDETWDAA